MNGQSLAEAFHDGTQTYGTAILSPSPKWVPVAEAAGLDFVFIDTEHAPMDREKVAWMCQAYRAAGLAPIVRIATCDPILASMAIDGGAVGIIGPYVEKREQIKALSGAVKYRPLKGRRLGEVLDDHASLEPKVKDYLAEYNEGNLLIVNIESTPALEDLESLVTAPGLDGVFVGPHDLSVSLGVPEDYRNPTFREAVEKIIRTCRAARIGVGVHLTTDDALDRQIEWAEMGANILIHSCDINFFARGLRQDLTRFGKATGRPLRKPTKSDDVVT